MRALHAPLTSPKLTEGRGKMEEDKRMGGKGDKGSSACDMASCPQLGNGLLTLLRVCVCTRA